MISLPSSMITYSLYNFVFVSSVTSSEKVDKAQRYADFTLLSVPYPGIDLLYADIILKKQFLFCSTYSMAIIITL